MPSDPPLPPLPDRVDPDALRERDDGALRALTDELRAAERATVAAMSPYERQLREIRARISEIATEQRRRERAAQVAQRSSVREAAKRGEMPSFAAAIASTDMAFAAATPLTQVRAFLTTGGEVGFGFATRPGVLAFTDGRQQRQARTWGDAVTLHNDGWEPGSPGIAGVRVHLSGSRVERVVAPADVVVEVPAERAADA